MNKNFLLASCLIFLGLGLCPNAFAQQKSISILESLKKIQHPDKDKDGLEEVLDNAKAMEVKERLGITSDTAETLQTLRDPFVSQLPQEATPVPPVRPPVDDVHPQPLIVVPTPPVRPVEKPDLKISGLIWNTNKPQAIINSQVVTIGDVVDAWVITAISKNGVEFQHDGQTFTIEQKSTLTNGNTETSNEADKPRPGRSSTATFNSTLTSRELPKRTTPQDSSYKQNNQLHNY